MSDAAVPNTEEEIADLVATARTDGAPLEIKCGATRSRLGRPVQADRLLSLTGLSGITLYEPGALTLIARAGTPLAIIEEALRAEGQRLAFEPMDHRALFGTQGAPSIGGVVACNISGPRRIHAGACRDSLIGVRFVDGSGQIIKNGGRVMKNVTGLDLVKLICGSFGTLGVITEVSFKVLPAAEREATLAVDGLSIEEAVTVMSRALGSPFEVTGAAHLPEQGSAARTVLRVEGFAEQVDYRLSSLRKTVASQYDVSVIDGAAHDALWRHIRDVASFKDDKERPVWRICVKPGDAPGVVKSIGRLVEVQYLLDWGGGLIWVQVDDAKTARANEIRSIVSAHGGHATLVRASETLRASTSVFQPRAGRITELSNSVRRKFDPADILNPGRMA